MGTKSGRARKLGSPAPSFAARYELARYVPPGYRRRVGRISSAAFLRNPGDTYLSVNSLEVESLSGIAKHYKSIFQQGQGSVAVACRKIMVYNRAALAAGVFVTRDFQSKIWLFLHHGSNLPAYRHRPSHLSKSHCGVEFTISFAEELAEKKFARRLAGVTSGKRARVFNQ